MFIFRMEHKRDQCIGDYAENGKSLTGHGPYTICSTNKTKPNFGFYGKPPSIRMMVHERCAVTARQFDRWCGSATYCISSNQYCDGNSQYCAFCPLTYEIDMDYHYDWNIVAYWVDPDQECIDWRIDNEQVVFNPEFAIQIGPVELWEVYQFVHNLSLT